MAYSVDLRERAVSMIEKGKSKVEVAELLEIGIATLYRWLRKKAAGESLRPSKNGSFIRKIDPKILEE
ncbi:IS630 transposase-related protein, partial [Wolbachia endosymbiont of Ceratitis capitata]